MQLCSSGHQADPACNGTDSQPEAASHAVGGLSHAIPLVAQRLLNAYCAVTALVKEVFEAPFGGAGVSAVEKYLQVGLHWLSAAACQSLFLVRACAGQYH